MKKAKELNLTVKGTRLLTVAELNEFEDVLKDLSMAWWLADEDPNDSDSNAYAEGNYTDEDMYCAKGEPNTFIRVALDLESASDAGLKSGDEFVFKGYVFTVLSDTLAISNNFLGCGAICTEEWDVTVFGQDPGPVPNVKEIIATLFENYEE